jgi:protein gp88
LSPPSEWSTAELTAYVGGLSAPSKMPGYAYSLPARECITGGRLQAVAGSTCSGCYALKGRYLFPNVQAALYRRLESITKPMWPEVMAELITRKDRGCGYFRWHDSGDLQSVDHLRRIVRVAEMTPSIRHWLPTREYRIVREYLGETPPPAGSFPPNFNVRMSAHMIGGAIPSFPGMPVTVSSVTAGSAPAEAHRCPAPQQGNECGDCRACWSADVRLVDYHLH